MLKHLTVTFPPTSNYLINLNFVFSGIVGNSAATLLTTIEEMHLLSKKIFFNSLSLHASKLMDKVCFKIIQLPCFKIHFNFPFD